MLLAPDFDQMKNFRSNVFSFKSTIREKNVRLKRKTGMSKYLQLQNSMTDPKIGTIILSVVSFSFPSKRHRFEFSPDLMPHSQRRPSRTDLLTPMRFHLKDALLGL